MFRRRKAGPGGGFDGGGEDAVKRQLGRLVPAPVPTGLRQRTLDRAGQARRSTLLTPALRRAAAACLVMIAALLLADPIVGRHEADRLRALLDGRRPGAAPPIRPEQELAEILGLNDPTVKWLVRRQPTAAGAGRQEPKYGEARRALKGWLDHEASQGLI